MNYYNSNNKMIWKQKQKLFVETEQSQAFTRLQPAATEHVNILAEKTKTEFTKWLKKLQHQ